MMKTKISVLNYVFYKLKEKEIIFEIAMTSLNTLSVVNTIH
jgi:hypothetical protein